MVSVHSTSMKKNRWPSSSDPHVQYSALIAISKPRASVADTFGLREQTGQLFGHIVSRSDDRGTSHADA
jgi:hypothetical protein